MLTQFDKFKRINVNIATTALEKATCRPYIFHNKVAYRLDNLDIACRQNVLHRSVGKWHRDKIQRRSKDRCGDTRRRQFQALRTRIICIGRGFHCGAKLQKMPRTHNTHAPKTPRFGRIFAHFCPLAFPSEETLTKKSYICTFGGKRTMRLSERPMHNHLNTLL